MSMLPGSGTAADRRVFWARWCTLAAVLLAVSAYLLVPPFRAWVDGVTAPLAMGNFHAVKGYILSFGWWAPAVSAMLMILQTLIAPLPAFVVTIANAMAFGPVYGFLLSLLSASVAAFVAFYLARLFGRPFVERWSGRGRMDELIARHGAWAILILRLFPVVSFDYVSYAAGLTALRPSVFGVATLIGMLPATAAFSLVGYSMDTASRWALLGGGGLLAVLLLAAALGRRSRAWRSLKGGGGRPRPPARDSGAV